VANGPFESIIPLLAEIVMKTKCLFLASLMLAGYAMLTIEPSISAVDRVNSSDNESPFADPLTYTAAQDEKSADQQPARDPQVNEQIRKAVANYAGALQRLAEADLAKAREANRRVPETIPAAVVRGLENNAALSAARVKLFSGEKPDPKDNPFLKAARDAIATAEQNLQQAQNANARVPGAVSDGEVERRKAEVDIAKSRLEVANFLDVASPMEVARWEILQLQEAVNNLQNRVQLLQYRN
jgi:hypothetical protein